MFSRFPKMFQRKWCYCAYIFNSVHNNKLLARKTMRLLVWYCAEILPKVRLRDHYDMYEPCPSHPLEIQRFNRPLPGDQFENFQSTSSWHETNNKRKLESLTKEESLLLNLANTLLHPKYTFHKNYQFLFHTVLKKQEDLELWDLIM